MPCAAVKAKDRERERQKIDEKELSVLRITKTTKCSKQKA